MVEWNTDESFNKCFIETAIQILQLQTVRSSLLGAESPLMNNQGIPSNLADWLCGSVQ